MYTHRVYVLHIAYGNRCVITVTHYLVLYLLVSLDALLNEHLMSWRNRKCTANHLSKFRFVIRKSAARASERKRRPEHNRESNPASNLEPFIFIICNLRLQHRLTEFLAQLLEQLPVLGTLDAVTLGTKQLRSALAQHTFFIQLHCEIESGLSADSRQNGIRSLVPDYPGEIFQGERFHINLVRHRRISHYRRRIGIAQYHFITLFSKRYACLGTGVVELCCLSDHDWPRPDYENFPDVTSSCHFPHPSCCLNASSHSYILTVHKKRLRSPELKIQCRSLNRIVIFKIQIAKHSPLHICTSLRQYL